MADKKIIAVVGATGAQGGGLVRAILADPSGGFARPRASPAIPTPTRPGRSRARGAEVVAADLDDQASLRARVRRRVRRLLRHQLLGALLAREGARPGRATMAQAAKAAGVQHVIWSTLEDTRKWVPLDDDRMPTLMGKYKVPHFDAKGEADQIFRELGVPTTFLLTSFYWDNFIYFGVGPAARARTASSRITFPMGDKKLPGIAAEDIGKCAYGIFKRGQEFIGKTVGIAGEHLTGAEMAAALTQGAGPGGPLQRRAARGVPQLRLPRRRRPGQHVPVQARLQRLLRRCADLAFTRSLNPELQTFEQWLERYGQRSRLPA